MHARDPRETLDFIITSNLWPRSYYNIPELNAVELVLRGNFARISIRLNIACMYIFNSGSIKSVSFTLSGTPSRRRRRTDAMATAASVTTDVTTCPICIDLFDNPKSLPCVHTFCLKCLQGHFKEKCLGDEVPCPMCRKEFEIPSNGLKDLPHNFFIQQLVDVRKSESTEVDDVPCDVCMAESGKGSEKIPTATTYCVDCKQKLCEPCSKSHRRMKGGAHQVKPLGVEVEQELIQRRGSSCDKHNEEQVKLYCYDCKENICLMCSTAKAQIPLGPVSP